MLHSTCSLFAGAGRRRGCILGQQGVSQHIMENSLPHALILLVNTFSLRYLHKSFQRRNHSFFSHERATTSACGAEVWLGLFQSVRPSERQLLINADVTAGLFTIDQGVLDFLTSEGLMDRNGRIAPGQGEWKAGIPFLFTAHGP